MKTFDWVLSRFRMKGKLMLPKERFKSRIDSAFENDAVVIVDRILVGDGKNPARETGNYTPVWIPLVTRESTGKHGRFVCQKVYSLYRSEFMDSWNAIEVFVGSFKTNGSFDKAYRLTAFNEDVDDVLQVLEIGLPGRLRGADVGWLFYPKVDVELIDKS